MNSDSDLIQKLNANFLKIGYLKVKDHVPILIGVSFLNDDYTALRYFIVEWVNQSQAGKAKIIDPRYHVSTPVSEIIDFIPAAV